VRYATSEEKGGASIGRKSKRKKGEELAVERGMQTPCRGVDFITYERRHGSELEESKNRCSFGF